MYVKRIINGTPHDLDIGDIRIPTDLGQCVRVTPDYKQMANIVGIPIWEIVGGKNQNLPEKEEGVIIAVSAMVCQHNPDRDDLYVPRGGGKTPCKGLIRNPLYKKMKHSIYAGSLVLEEAVELKEYNEPKRKTQSGVIVPKLPKPLPPPRRTRQESSNLKKAYGVYQQERGDLAVPRMTFYARIHTLRRTLDKVMRTPKK